MNLDGTAVCVAGLGVTGPSAARALAARGARVVAVDVRDGDRERAIAAELRALGVEVPATSKPPAKKRKAKD